MERRLRDLRGHINSKEDLWEKLQDVWNGIEVDVQEATLQKPADFKNMFYIFLTGNDQLTDSFMLSLL